MLATSTMLSLTTSSAAPLLPLPTRCALNAPLSISDLFLTATRQGIINNNSNENQVIGDAHVVNNNSNENEYYGEGGSEYFRWKELLLVMLT